MSVSITRGLQAPFFVFYLSHTGTGFVHLCLTALSKLSQVEPVSFGIDHKRNTALSKVPVPITCLQKLLSALPRKCASDMTNLATYTSNLPTINTPNHLT